MKIRDDAARKAQIHIKIVIEGRFSSWPGFKQFKVSQRDGGVLEYESFEEISFLPSPSLWHRSILVGKESSVIVRGREAVA
jgi:hypothetical protein